jgi:hypothetical protein
MAWTWFTRSRRAKAAKAIARPFRPALDVLEERTVPDVNYLLLTLDSSASVVMGSGTFAGTDATEQQPGSLTSHFSGYLGTWYDDGALSGTPSLQFLGGSSALYALNATDPTTGDELQLEPAPGGDPGTAPANFAAEATVFGGLTHVKTAARDLAITMDTPDPLPLDSYGNFASTQTISAIGGSADYNVTGYGATSGTFPVTGQWMNMSSTQGTLTDLGGGSFHITVPVTYIVNRTIAGQPVTITVQGTLVADAQLPALTLNPPDRDITVPFTHGGPAVNLTGPDATITSTGEQTLSQLQVTLLNNLDQDSEALTADLSGTVGLSQTFTHNADGTATLTITGTASLATYQDVLRTIQYANSSPTPDTSDPYRYIVFQATDDLGNQSFFSYSYVYIT